MKPSPSSPSELQEEDSRDPHRAIIPLPDGMPSSTTADSSLVSSQDNSFGLVPAEAPAPGSGVSAGPAPQISPALAPVASPTPTRTPTNDITADGNGTEVPRTEAEIQGK